MLILEKEIYRVFHRELPPRLSVGGPHRRMRQRGHPTVGRAVAFVIMLSVKSHGQRLLACGKERLATRMVAPERRIRIRREQMAEPVYLVNKFVEFLGRAELLVRRQKVGILPVESAFHVSVVADERSGRQVLDRLADFRTCA